MECLTSTRILNENSNSSSSSPSSYQKCGSNNNLITQSKVEDGRSEGVPDYQVYGFYTSCSFIVYFMFEELNVPYQTCLINIRQGDHFKGNFAEMSPNNKIPMLIDNTLSNYDDDGVDETPMKIFESGAILLYLSEKYNKFLPSNLMIRKRSQVQQWLSWAISEWAQAFKNYVFYFIFSDTVVPYAMKKAEKEVETIFSVLDKHLSTNNNSNYICNNEFSIADIACFGWGCYISLNIFKGWEKYTNVKRWVDTMLSRPAISKLMPIVEKTLKSRQLKRLDTCELVI